MATRDGIDVSHWQGNIDWHAVAAAGVRWAACKATQGTGYVDPTFETNRAGMAAAGIPYRLFYHWPEPGNDPVAEARHYLAVVGGFDLGEGTMSDAEEEGLSVNQVLAWAGQVEPAGNRPIAVYTGAFVSGGTLWDSTSIYNGLRARVLAAYTSEDKARGYAAPYAWDCWQYTGSGSCPGVSGACDLDQVDNWAIFDRVCSLPGGNVAPGPDDDDYVNVHPGLVA